MPTETIWTALPAGRTRTSVRLAVHVTPRLTTEGADGVLADFPAMVSWPPGDLELTANIAGTDHSATITSAPEPALWGALFPGSSLVRSHTVTDRSQAPIHTYPLTKIAGFLKDQYTKILLDSPEHFPAIVDLLANGFEDIRFSGRDGMLRWRQINEELRGVLLDNKVVDTRSASTTTFDFAQLEDFFASLDASDPAVEAAYGAPVEQPQLDFHDAVQFVNQHPTLLRLLGLVLDLEIDTSAAPVPLGPTTVTVRPTAESLGGTVVRTPLTHARVTTDGFDAVPRPGTTHLLPGWLRLEDPNHFAIVQVEADGGGLKAVDFAGNLHRKTLNGTSDTAEDAALPTLRTDGFAVARLGQGQAVHDDQLNGAAKEAALAADALDVHLDDLVRGVRVDVQDSATGRWHSLMQRTGQYELAGGTTVIPVADEGTVGTTASKKPLSDDLYLSEEVFWWDGWSLVVPRPGKALSTDPTAPDPLIERPPNVPAGFDARVHFDITPGTLPRLRYGTRYRFRARLVDLAGNSLPLDDPDATHATPPLPFGRLEPPQAPPVLLRTPAGPGESAETVVLRSNFDQDPGPPVVDRHLVPAKVGQLTVEQSGLIDDPDPDPAAYVLLATRDAATLANHPDLTPGSSTTEPYYDVDALEVTWAPDPSAVALALKALDGPHAGHLELALVATGPWPDHRATRLSIVEGAGAPAWDPSTHVLTVALDKADIVHARLSSVLDSGDLGDFGLWHWGLEALPPGPAGDAKQQELIGLIRAGQHWMFEPYRVLTLVHAVRQPLARPEFPQLPHASRGLGDNWTRISGPLDFNRKSTSRIDVLASWREPVDDGPGAAEPADVGTPGAVVVDRQGAFVLDIDHDATDGPPLHPTRLNLRERHELGDTRHRRITYRAVATTRFGEYFTSSATFPFDGAGSIVVLDTGTPPNGVTPGSVKLTHTVDDRAVPLVEGTHYTVDQITGAVTFGDGNPGGELPADGTTIDAVYLVPPITRETIDPEAGDPDPGPGEYGPQLVSVPSSARPQAPRIHSVLPTFGWTDDTVTGNDGEVTAVTSTRTGNGLRVYLERPWWTSGEGELLGVVLWPLAEQPDPPDLESAEDPSDDADRRRPYVTQWGQDPIHGSRRLPHRYPRLSTLTNAIATDTSLTLAELGSNPALPVNVAGHPVGFDAARDLWYCDIDLDPGPAYVPFVRLALARWQPASIPTAELSRTVLADFVQLAPDRFATVAFDDGDDSVLGVTLTGPTHTATEATDGADPGSARVIVEERRSDFSGELAWEPVGQPTTLTASLASGVGHWIGQVDLPGPRQPGRYRLILEQFELLGSEPSEKPLLANPFIRTTPVPTPRLVHTDVIPL